MTLNLIIWYWVSAIVLAACLYPFVKRMIFVGRVRRFERKMKRESTEEERRRIEKKLIPLVVVLVVTFSFIFTRYVVMMSFVRN